MIENKNVCLDSCHLCEKIIIGTIKTNDKNNMGR
jgi:hypothetical protein